MAPIAVLSQLKPTKQGESDCFGETCGRRFRGLFAGPLKTCKRIIALIVGKNNKQR
jgi:hypothetical protein